MSLLSETAKKEISKKFDLPERKSKIATMLKQNDDLVYCICRTTDSTSFMICCDACEEWYHGHCIGITQLESKIIKHYYCELCIDNNPTLRIEYKKKPGGLVQNKLHQKMDADPPDRAKITKPETKRGRPSLATLKKRRESTEEQKPKPKPKKCGYCHGCQRKYDCGECSICISNVQLKIRERQLCNERQCENSIGQVYLPRDVVEDTLGVLTSASESENWAPPEPKKPKTAPAKRGRKAAPKKVEKKPRRGKKFKIYETDSSDAIESEEEIQILKQCSGPTCVNETRIGSKYCSDDCGIRLASARLYHILPSRMKEYAMKPSIATEHNNRDLEENYRKVQVIKKGLVDLDVQRRKLDQHISRVQHMTVDAGHEDDEPDEDGSTYCFTCGQDVVMKTSMRHMEKCFKKCESQTSFGSVFKTNIEGVELFCDFYNTGTGMYCKRLAGMCPEHCKDPKIGEHEICGFQLLDNELRDTEEVCRMPKRRCNKHFAWERLNRAVIDLERVTLYLKLDDLLDQERSLRIGMANRAGVLALLLNSSFDHELGEERMRLHQQEANRIKEMKEANRLKKIEEIKRIKILDEANNRLKQIEKANRMMVGLDEYENGSLLSYDKQPTRTHRRKSLYT